MLVVQEFVSVDGFAADASGEFGFADVISDWSPIDSDQMELMSRTGIVMLGRKSYELFVKYWPSAEHVLAEHINTTPRAVLSQTLQSAPWGEWPAATVQRGSLTDTVGRLTETAAPQDVLVWGSLTLTKSLLSAGLVDELRLIVCPIILGTGIAVTPDDPGQTTLTTVAAKPYANGAVQLSYRT
jgi:dihydrofolate reductase